MAAAGLATDSLDGPDARLTRADESRPPAEIDSRSAREMESRVPPETELARDFIELIIELIIELACFPSPSFGGPPPEMEWLGARSIAARAAFSPFLRMAFTHIARSSCDLAQ